MPKTKGGARRVYKKVGRQPVARGYREFMRSRAQNGIGHTADGAQRPNAVSPTSDDAMSRSLYHGYKFNRK